MTDKNNDAVEYLTRQFDTAWSLAWYHLEGIGTAECHWQPVANALHVSRDPDGRWLAQWPETESYELGPPSVAWLTWHIGFWWSMVLDHSFGSATLGREDVYWPGTADGVRDWLVRLHDDWQRRLNHISGEELRSKTIARWPIQDRPFGDIVAWVNLELMKNASEIGYARFLYACRRNAQPDAAGGA